MAACNAGNMLELDPSMVSLVGVLKRRAEIHPDRTAYIFLDPRGKRELAITYGCLDGEARKIAGFLQSLGQPNDRVILFYPPGLEYITAFMGCLYAGMVAVPLYPPRPNQKLSRVDKVILNCGARLAVTSGAAMPAIHNFLRSAEVFRGIKAHATDCLAADYERAWCEPNFSSESLAFLQYTSGSTGTPKGVMVSHGNLMANEAVIGEAFATSEADIGVSWLPLYHDMGLIGTLLHPLYKGFLSVLMSPVSFVQDPLFWLETITRYRATLCGAPNFAYDLLLRRVKPEHLTRLDLSSWKVAFNGAEPVRAETLANFSRIFEPVGFGKAAFYPCYGMAEATLFITGGTRQDTPAEGWFDDALLKENQVQAAAADDPNARHLMGCGFTRGDHQLLIVDPENRQPVTDGGVGEIWFKGPSVAKGYWNRLEESAYAFDARTANGEGPFLRTGDLGFLEGQELYITGRLKDLIIIRGRNHYPSDIELTVERSHPAMRPNGAAAFSCDIQGEERLIVVVEVDRRALKDLDAESVCDTILAAVAEAHELQAYAVVLLKQGGLPKTSSGKVQRFACRDGFLSNALPMVAGRLMPEELDEETLPDLNTILAAQNDARRALVLLYLQRLAAMELKTSAANIEPNEPLTHMGLDSLASVALQHRLAEDLRVQFPLEQLLAGPTLNELVDQALPQLAVIDPATVAQVHESVQTTAVTKDQTFPLSYNQKALWFIHRLAPESPAYHISFAADILSELDAASLKRAFEVLLDRHAGLRTTFPIQDEQPVQHVSRVGLLHFERVDASNWEAERVDAFLLERSRRPFDLVSGPLLRLHLLTRGEQRHILLMTIHHIIADFRSLSILMDELRLLYGAENPATVLPPMTHSYGAYVTAQANRLEHADAALNYWRKELGDGPATLQLSTDFSRPPLQTYNGSSFPFKLDLRSTNALKELAASAGTTLYAALLSVFQTLLYRYSSQDDITVGTPALGRPGAAFDDVVGYFVNPVVMRALINEHDTFISLLNRTRDKVIGALAHQEYPFQLLVERLQPDRDASRSPLFQVMFVFQKPDRLEAAAPFALNESGATMDLGKLHLVSHPLPQRVAQFDLTLQATEIQDGISASLEFNTDLFLKESIARMADHFQTLLHHVLEQRHCPLSRLPLLHEGEMRYILQDWNRTESAYPADRAVHQLFEDRTAADPSRDALVYGEERLSYGALNRRANQLARHLQALGLGPEKRAAVCTRRTPDMITSMLAILKTGAAYIPLDPAYPAERVTYTLNDAQADVLITEAGFPTPEVTAQVVAVDGIQSELDALADTNLDVPVWPENLSHIIYTSGSTGKPKGVAIRHQGTTALIYWMHGVYPEEQLRGVLASTSICFDLSVFEIFGTTSWGGTIILADNALALQHLPAKNEVTLINTVPSAMIELLRTESVPPSVQVVNLAGEPLRNALLRHIFTLDTVKAVYNLYGPSEDTTYSTFARKASVRKKEKPTIGKPLSNTKVYILDRFLQPVPVGIAGEIFLTGHGLARGYHNRPELTAEKFIPNMFAEDGCTGTRLYRTGDQARYLQDGRIDFMGRIDHQVKLRGFRIELGEVEVVLGRHPNVNEAVAVIRTDRADDPRLVAYVVPKNQKTTADERTEQATTVLAAGIPQYDLQAYLRKHLPDFMVPSSIINLKALPLTPNGKLDRKALPAPDPLHQGPREGDYMAPRNPAEKTLVSFWENILDVQKVGIHDNFFNLGGHSLLATRLVSRVREAFDLELPVSAVFEAPTVAAMIKEIERYQRRGQGSPLPPIYAVDRDGLPPLSFAQNRLWFLYQLEGRNAAYNMPVTIALDGVLDTTALARSLNEIIRRHETMRTSFTAEGERPGQCIAPFERRTMPVVDLTDLEHGETIAHMVAAWESQIPFDLERGPLLRMHLLRLNPSRHILLATMHHINSDGWSLGVLQRELAAYYEAYAGGLAPEGEVLPDLEIQYADFAAWQLSWLRGGMLEKQRLYWSEKLAGAPVLIELPTDRPRPAEQTFRGALLHFRVPGALSAQLKAQARDRHATLFMSLLTVYYILLSRYSRQNEVVVGSPVANRTHKETEDLIGFFVNTLALHVSLEDQPDFLTLLDRVRGLTLDAYAHQDLPFEKLVEELSPERSLSHSPIFQVMFILQNAPMGEMRMAGVDLEPLDQSVVSAKFDLTLTIDDHDDTPRATLEYNTDLFDKTTAERFAGHYLRLLDAVVAEPRLRVAMLPLMDEPERRQLVMSWNDTRTEAPLEQNLLQLFALRVEKQDKETAVSDGSADIQFGELDAAANALAVQLQAHGVGPDTPVGICARRDIHLIVGMLGILKAGGAYVPLDPAYPSERIAYAIEDSGMRLLLTNRDLMTQLPGAGIQLVCLEDERRSDGGGPAARSITNDNLSHIIYTSGSTGKPKGVAIQNRGTAAMLYWAHRVYPQGAWSGVLASTSVCFDLSVYEIFGTLTRGGRVILAADALQLADHRCRGEVSLINTVPSAMSELLNMNAVPASAKVINLAGEPLRGELARRIHALGSVEHLFNLYGPSEDTTYSTYAEIESGETREPTIGRPIDNSAAYLVDAYLNPTPIGVPGELCMGGAGLARGYWQRPDLTAERFIPDPFAAAQGGRLYRTGDLVRYLPDGRLDFLGRVDHQVKLRGFRIELGEIEAVLRDQPNVENAVVLVLSDANGNARLAAFVQAVSDREAQSFAEGLKKSLQQRLPSYMVPGMIAVLEKMPLTPNGKVDRLALQKLGATETTPAQQTAPRSPREEILAGIFAEVLGLERVGVHDNFFESGGHSLLATRVAVRIQTAFHLELPVRVLFEFPTVAALAHKLDSLVQKAEGLPALRPAENRGPSPLSFAQNRLWFLDRLEGANPAYNIPVELELQGPLDVSVLERVLDGLIARHETLRTTFPLRDEQPEALVTPHVRFNLAVIDFSHSNHSAVLSVTSQEAQRVFHLDQGPLLRLYLLRLAGNRHHLLANMHHIISDGWSLGVFQRELARLYESYIDGAGEDALPPLSIQYTDFARWQRDLLQGDRLTKQIAYWRQALAEAPVLLEIPADRPRPAVQTYNGAVFHFDVPANLTRQLHQLARAGQSTLFMTLLSAFYVLLHRYSRQDHVVVGSPVANRTNQAIEDLIGFFVNNLALAVDLSDNPSFKGLLDRVRGLTLDAYAHQDLPFEKLVEELRPERSLSHSPIFQVMFILQNTPAPHHHKLKMRGRDLQFASAKFDLTLSMEERNGGLNAKLEYNTDLFDALTVSRMAGHFEHLLGAIVTDPRQQVSALPLMNLQERRQILITWNDTRQDFERGRLSFELVDAMARRNPNALAVADHHSDFTYAWLNEEANRLAACLQSMGVGLDTPVGVCARRDVRLIAALLGILKAGGAYVPLDPAYPSERLAYTLADAKVEILLTNQDLFGELATTGVRLIALETVPNQNTDLRENKPSPGNLSHIIYTSGSTGKPKGVAIPHRGTSAMLAWAHRHYAKDVWRGVLGATSICFDLSVYEIFGPLTQGGALILADDALALPSHRAREQVTLINTVPSAMTELLHLEGVPKSVKVINLAGEPLRGNLARRIHATLPAVQLYNLYGPSEDTTYSTHAKIEAKDRREPTIGRPLDNSRVYLLDRAMQPTPIGVPGILHMAGEGLARGYYQRPDLTAASFIPDPFSQEPGARLYHTGDLARYLADGEIAFMGRADHQVKLRGFRIELGEIETALRDHTLVDEAIVMVLGQNEGSPRLVGFVEARAGQAGDALSKMMRSELEHKLPNYMVPNHFVVLARFPRTPNGKVDRSVLKGMDFGVGGTQADAYVPPRTPREEMLAGMFAEVLGLDRVGVRDNFFDLGGHSLLATRVAARVQKSLGLQLPIRALFETPTVASLAERLDALEQNSDVIGPPLPVDRSKDIPLSYSQRRLWFLDQLEGANATYNLPYIVQIDGPLDVAAVGACFDEMVNRHEILRTSFGSKDGEPVQIIKPEIKLQIPVVDIPPSLIPTDLDAENAADAPAVNAILAKGVGQPFQLADAPLIRVLVVRISASAHILLVNVHHIIADGWTVDLIVGEFAANYVAKVNGQSFDLPEPTIQFADFAHWQRNKLNEVELERQGAFWKRELTGLPALLELPADKPRPSVRNYQGGTIFFNVPGALHERLAAYSRRENSTLFMTMLGVFEVLLFRYSNQDDFAVGTAIANRAYAELEHVLGYFANTLVMRAKMNAAATFAQHLARTRERALAAYAHQDIPFEQVVEVIQPARSLSYTPLFQVLMLYRRKAFEKPQLPGLTLNPIDAHGEVSKYDLTLMMDETPAGFQCALEFSSDLFERATAARLAVHYQTLLLSLLEHPECAIEELPMLSERERGQMLVDWNDTKIDFPREQCIHHLVEARAQQEPEAVAVVYRHEMLTYSMLDQRANQLAHYLRLNGAGPDKRVAVCMGRSIDMLVGLLGILKAGAGYVPLDPSYPKDRLSYIVADARAAILLVQIDRDPGIQASECETVIHVEPGWPQCAGMPTDTPKANVAPNGLAYAIYTSGSSGKPKGVMVAHRNAVNFFTAMDHALGEKESRNVVWLAVTSMSFDISLLELFWTLVRGFRVVLQPDPPQQTQRTAVAAKPMDFSLFYFASDEDKSSGDKYRLLLDGARFGDENGFSAVWTPERHFHAFGGQFPNPSVAAAAVAAVTQRIHIRAGSVVLPLHDPIRVAEEWSMVDNISNGRAGISIASGWHPNDFVFFPDIFQERHAVMRGNLTTLRHLWSGGGLKKKNGVGNEIEVSIRPRPIQAQLPIWVTAAGNPETFKMAGELGANILTHMLGQDADDLREKIALYRKTLADNGHDPANGRVSLMLHTFIGDDPEEVREIVKEPFKDYLRSSINLMKPLADTMELDLVEDREALVEMGFQRFYNTSALMGTPETCAGLIDEFKEMGVDEIGCLIDFGIDEDTVLSGLKTLDRLRRRANPPKPAKLAALGIDQTEDLLASEQILRYGVSHLQCTPSFARRLLEEEQGAAAAKRLRKLLVGGEALPPDLLAHLHQAEVHDVYNMYGPTETTVWSSTCHLHAGGDGRVTIGTPIGNTGIYLQDGKLGPVPVGVPGDLYIGGEGVTRGYWRRPELTAERFIPHPYAQEPGERLYNTGDRARFLANGEIEFLGRNDHQVKVRGFRIELGEIEALLNNQEGIRQSAVTVRKDGPGGPRLVAYVVPEAGLGIVQPRVKPPADSPIPHYVLPNGLTLFHNDSRQLGGLFQEIWADEIYLKHGITIPENATIFDVGANVGGFTLFAHGRRPDATIYSFEPIPPTHEVLRANRELYNIKGKAFHFGLSDREETATFTYYPHMSGLSGRFGDIEEDQRMARTLIHKHLRDGSAAIQVSEAEISDFLEDSYRGENFDCRLKTLSDIIAAEKVTRIDLLKVDVEKSELLVLRGIADADWPKIRQITMEVDGSANRDAVSEMLSEKGFEVFVDDFIRVEETNDDPEFMVYMLYARRPEDATVKSVEAGSNATLMDPAEMSRTLRRILVNKLPEYMVPAEIVALAELPHTPNGKIDKKALPAPELLRPDLDDRPAFVAPQNVHEQKVADVWRDVLERDRIGMNDNFFELGGTSLLLTKVLTRLRHDFDRKIPMVSLFKYPTVKTLAAYLEKETPQASSVQNASSRAETRVDHRRKLAARRRGPGRN